MPYTQVLNGCTSLSNGDRSQLSLEFDLLRRELDEIRANFNTLLTALDGDAGVTLTTYSATHSLATTGATVTTVTAAAARRFTKT